MARTSRSTPVTGRDGYIISQALLYAIAHIQSLPEEKQEFSNMCDMCALVLASKSPFALGQIVGVEQHTGHMINLWPLDDADYTADELAQKVEWEGFIAGMRAKMAEVIANWERHQVEAA